MTRDYLLSAAAAEDLQQIFDAGFVQFGRAQAERYQYELHGRFQLLADFPDIAGKAAAVLSRPIYRFPFGSHVILFTKSDSGVTIVRVFHGRMDWPNLLVD